MFRNKTLERNFYLRDTMIVAGELLGKIIILARKNKIISGIITETEAYIGATDPACHAFGRITKRNSILYGIPGMAYVYFIYGNYYCFNVVTEPEGSGSAVLIRAVEPVDGIKEMQRNRKKVISNVDLTNGPAKLCMAFGINNCYNGVDLTKGGLIITANNNMHKFQIAVTRRIGLKKGEELPYRFYIYGNKFITKHKNNKEIIKIIKS